MTAGPLGGVPLAVAWFETVPAFTIACVSVTLPVMVLELLAPGARLAIGPPVMVIPGSGSVTEILVRVTLPVLVTVKA